MPRIARDSRGRALVGDEDGYVSLSSVDPALETTTAALEAAAEGELPSVAESTERRVPEEHLSLSIPLDDVGKLWGIGLNYAEHASDLDEQRPDEPASFMKPATAATGPGGPIRLPPRELTNDVTAEAELGVVIGRRCSDVSEDEADDVIAGYVPIIDVTAEDVLRRNPRYLTRAKSFDSFLVFGSAVVTTDEIPDLDPITVRTIVDDAVVAENDVSNMMTKPMELVAYHSQVMTLEPGDLISTGTPGAGTIEEGETVRASVEGVGSVSAPVVRTDE